MTTKDMLQILIEGQNALREEMKDGFKSTHGRLDKQGKQLPIPCYIMN